jgi:hypothetical protein
MGGEGQKVDRAFIVAHASGIDRARALALFDQLKAAGIDPILCWDCCGIITEDLIKRGVISGDKSADALLKMCSIINKEDVYPGCLCFRVSDTDKDSKNEKTDHGTHVGEVVAIENGRPIVIQSKGHAYGVIREDIDGSGAGFWEVFGVPSYLAKMGVDIIKEQEDEEMLVYFFQRAAFAAGYKTLKDGATWKDAVTGEVNGCDNSRGPWTQDVIKQVQKKHGLKQTGEIDGKTIAAVMSEVGGNAALADYQNRVKSYTAGVMAAANMKI